MRVPREFFLILGLGFLLRIWGISFGLPDLYHADEPIVVNHAVAYGTGDLNPHFFKIPPLVSYLLFFVYGVYFVGGRLLGVFGSVHEFQLFFVRDPSSFYLIARVIFGALAGTVTIGLLYILLSRHFTKLHGLVASFFLAVSFLHVRDSHYIYADIPLVLMFVLSFFFIFRVLEREKIGDYVGFGVMTGIATATKYNGAFIFVPFLLAHFLRKKFRLPAAIDKNLILSCAMSLMLYSLLNPFSWLDWRFFLRELSVQGAAQGGAGFFHHLIYSLKGGLGSGLWVFALLGVLLSLFRPHPKRVLLLSFALFYYCPVLAFFGQSYDRYALPLVPFASFFAADFLCWMGQQVRLSKFLFWVLAFLLAAPSLAEIVLSNRIFSEEDVRTAARNWVEATIPSGSRIALDVPFFMPRLKPTLRQLEEKRETVLSAGGGQAKAKKIELLLEDARHSDNARYELYFLKDADPKEEFLFSHPSLPYDLEEVMKRSIQYVIVTRMHREEQGSFYGRLVKEAELVARFSPYKDPKVSWAFDRQPLTGGPFLWSELVSRARNGQIIEVYRLS